MQSPQTHPHHKILRGLSAVVSSLAAAFLLIGCGGALSHTGATGSTIRFTGNIHGGQQPVNGATVQLYTVGVTGLKSASATLINGPAVKSDSNGNFSITGTYDCTTVPATQVYITASGGDPGSGTNSALTLVAALGSCANLLANAATTFIQLNEITTVAAAYALAPFAADIAHIGASGSGPTGILNAFANAALLASTTTGASPGANLAPGVTVPATEINTLANIIAACINSPGPGSSGCNALLGATGAANTFAAAQAIARNPGATAITALYVLSTPQAPFQPSLSSTTQPNDYTVAVNYNPGSLAAPYAVALDTNGNAWIANEGGSTVTELSTTGAVLATATAPNLFGPQGIAVDKLGNVWVANTAGNSVVKFTLTSGAITATSSFTSGGITAPSAIALDADNNVFVANFNGNSVTGLDVNGAPLSGSPFLGSGNITVPSGIAVGQGSGAIFVTSGNGSIIKLTNAGAFQATLNDTILQGPVAVAIGNPSQVTATGFTTGSAITGALGEYTTDGAAANNSPVTSGLSSPAGIASDSTSFWVANSTTSGSLSQFVYGSAAPASPAAGFGSLNTPVGVAIDSTGSVWTANSGNNTVSKFIGLAVPVATPLSTSVGPVTIPQ